jgi:flagellar export protein FliJ
VKRYRFRLEPVLHVRRSEQDAARGALLAATAEVGAQQHELEQRQAAYAVRVQRPLAATAPDFRLEQSRRQALGQAVLAQQVRLAQAREQQELARESWVAAAARVGALERLDERQRAAHRVAELKEDDLLTDELVVGRHGREHG